MWSLTKTWQLVAPCVCRQSSLSRHRVPFIVNPSQAKASMFSNSWRTHSVLSFSPAPPPPPPHGGHFGQDAPQMPSLIALIPPSELFISGTLVCIEILVQILKHILQTIIFLSYYTDKDCTGTTITVMKGV